MHNSRYRIGKTPPLRLGALHARSALRDFILPPHTILWPSSQSKILPTGLFKCNDFHIETKKMFNALDVLDPSNFNILVAPLFQTHGTRFFPTVSQL